MKWQLSTSLYYGRVARRENVKINLNVTFRTAKSQTLAETLIASECTVIYSFNKPDIASSCDPVCLFPQLHSLYLSCSSICLLQ